MQEMATATQYNKLGFSVKELAKLVGVCERKIWDEIKSKRLQTVRIGTRVIIRPSAVDAWLSKAEESARAEK